MYKIAVAALFKNESHIIEEWIEHYLARGVEHIYLINDNSTDDFLPKIQKYIDSGIITLFNADYSYYEGRQPHMYNHFIIPVLKETKWMIMVDLDEFMWSPVNKDLNVILDICKNYAQIQVSHSLFGSNGLIEQPKSVVESFTKRAKNIEGFYKYIINTDYEYVCLNVHSASFADKNYETDASKFVRLGPEYFRLNHYSCQSLNFWKEVKCTRGDSNNYRARTLEDFYKIDVNEVEDFDLINQR
jgi:hypothetical protein